MSKNHTINIKEGSYWIRLMPLIVFILLTLISAFSLFSLHVSYTDKRDKETRHFLSGLARTAAALVDADLHNQIRSQEQMDADIYQSAVKPLIKLHQSFDFIKYLYTMIDKDGQPFYILDTASDTKLLNERDLELSDVMEPYVGEDEDFKDWLDTVASGNVYLDDEPYEDEYGTFLSASAPFYTSDGQYAGFVGIDISIDTLSDIDREYKTKLIKVGGLNVTVILIITLLIWLLKNKACSYHQQLKDMSFTDPLTGAMNRRGAKQGFDRELDRLRRYKQPFCFITIDIDNFKGINDTLGHKVGDQVLVAVIQAAKSSVRTTDIVARMGGDEFLLLLPETHLEQSIVVSERIMHRVKQNTMDQLGIKNGIGLSLGGVMVNEKDDWGSLYLKADAALYEAKRSGKGRVVIHGE